MKSMLLPILAAGLFSQIALSTPMDFQSLETETPKITDGIVYNDAALALVLLTGRLSDCSITLHRLEVAHDQSVRMLVTSTEESKTFELAGNLEELPNGNFQMTSVERTSLGKLTITAGIDHFGKPNRLDVSKEVLGVEVASSSCSMDVTGGSTYFHF